MSAGAGEAVTISARDGYRLAGNLFVPGNREPAVVVVVNSATAVPRKYYYGFARYLAARGAATLTYDYRGIGGSAPPCLRGFKARMRDWAERDVAGAIDWAAERYPRARLGAIGHSVGGHALGLADNNHRIDRAVAVAAQSGYWGYSARPERYRVLALMAGLLPVLTQVAGYAPASKLGIGEDLPKGVLMEWARWCRSRDYFFSDRSLESLGNFERLVCPLLSLRAADDPWATEGAVGHFIGHFTNAPVTHRVVEPQEAGVRRLGHFGPFRSRAKDTVWREIADWVLDPADAV